MLKPIFSLLMLLFIASTLAAQISSSQTSIYFDQRQAKLSPKNEADIKDFLKKVANPDDFELIVHIYTDSMPDYNNPICEKRLDTLKYFLKEQGFAKVDFRIFKAGSLSIDPKTPTAAELRNGHNKVELKLLSLQVRNLDDIHQYFYQKYRTTATYHPQQDTLICTPSYASFRIKGNSFVQKNGQPPAPPIRVEITEAQNNTDMGLLKLPMLCDSVPIYALTAFNISAFDAKGNSLSLASGKKIEVIIGLHPAIKNDFNFFTADRPTNDYNSPINWKSTPDTFSYIPKIKVLPSLISFVYRSMEGTSLDLPVVPFPTRPVYKVGLPPVAPQPNNSAAFAAAVQKYKTDSLAYAQQNVAAFMYSDSIEAAMRYMLVGSNAYQYTNVITEHIEQCIKMKEQLGFYDEVIAQAAAFGFEDIAKELAQYKQQLIDNIDGGKISESIRRALIQNSRSPLFNAFSVYSISKMQFFPPNSYFQSYNVRQKVEDVNFQMNYKNNNKNNPKAPTFEAYCEDFYKRVGYTIYNNQFLDAMIAMQREANKMGFERKINEAFRIKIAADKSIEKLSASLDKLGYSSGDTYSTRRIAHVSQLGWFCVGKLNTEPLVPTLKVRFKLPVTENMYVFAIYENKKTVCMVNVVDNAYEIVAPKGFFKNPSISLVAIKIENGNLYVYSDYIKLDNFSDWGFKFDQVKLSNLYQKF